MEKEEDQPHLDALMTFLAVARLGWFTAAGEALGINHSTVSRRIAALERSLGSRVLSRTATGWEVTNQGQRALIAAERVEEAVTTLMLGDGEKEGQVSGVIRLGAPDAFAVHIATPALAKLQRPNPGLRVEIISATQPARQNRSGMDLEIVVGQPQVRRAHSEHVLDYSLGLYATKHYLDAHGAPASIKALADHRLNYYVEAVPTLDDLDRAPETLPDMDRGIASTNVLSHITATLSGAGIGLLPDYVADSEPRLMRLLPEEYQHQVSYWAVGREEAVRNPTVQAVFAALRDYGQQLTTDS